MKRILALAIAMLAASSVQALTYNTYTDRAAFDAAVTGTETETFDAEATGSITTTRTFEFFMVELMGSDFFLQAHVSPGTDGTNIDGTNFLKYGTCSTATSLDLTPNTTTHGIGFDWRDTDPTGDDAEMVVVVDGTSFVFGTDGGSGFFGIVATDGEFSTVQFKDTPGDGGCLEYLGLDNVSLAGAAADTARFNVTKNFTNGDTGDVEVTLTCNAGLPLKQSFTIAGGDPAGVTFTVNNLPESGADCEVTETGSPAGYATSFDNGTAPSTTSCAFDDVLGGLRSCVITNTPEPTTIEVTTTTVVDDPSINISATTTISCSNVSPNSGPDDFGTYTATDTTGTFTVDWYAEPAKTAECTATMEPDSSVVEGDSCTFSFVLGDAEAGCDLMGTVFFEGIPTLSQYGLALMALLMLGVGFVGMRRFV